MIKLNVKEGKEFADVHTMAVIQAELENGRLNYVSGENTYWFNDFECRDLKVYYVLSVGKEIWIRLERI